MKKIIIILISLIVINNVLCMDNSNDDQGIIFSEEQINAFNVMLEEYENKQNEWQTFFEDILQEKSYESDNPRDVLNTKKRKRTDEQYYNEKSIQFGAQQEIFDSSISHIMLQTPIQMFQSQETKEDVSPSKKRNTCIPEYGVNTKNIEINVIKKRRDSDMLTCTICKRILSSKGAKVRHEKGHNNFCLICNKAIGKRYIFRHKLFHDISIESNLKCFECETGYFYPGDLKNHIKQVHNK